MLSLLIENCTANTKMLQRFVADIPEEKMCAQFPGLPNHPMWTIGHLTLVRGGMAGMVGKPAGLPAEWKARFGGNSTPVADAAVHPRKEEMIGIFLHTHEHMVEALRAADEAILNEPTPNERLAPFFPTKRHFLWNVLTTHDGMHLGQIGDFRRALGLGRVL
jgi:hypothetical protein